MEYRVRVQYRSRTTREGCGGVSYTPEPFLVFPDAPEGTLRGFYLNAHLPLPEGLISKLEAAAAVEVALFRDSHGSGSLKAREGETTLTYGEAMGLAAAFETVNPIWRLREETAEAVLLAAGLL